MSELNIELVSIRVSDIYAIRDWGERVLHAFNVVYYLPPMLIKEFYLHSMTFLDKCEDIPDKIREALSDVTHLLPFVSRTMNHD